MWEHYAWLWIVLSVCDCAISAWCWRNVSSTRDSVTSGYSNDEKRVFLTEYFWRNLRCLDSRWNTVSSVWYIFSIETFQLNYQVTLLLFESCFCGTAEETKYILKLKIIKTKQQKNMKLNVDRSPSQRACNYPIFQSHGIFAHRSIFSLNLSPIKIPHRNRVCRIYHVCILLSIIL